MTLLTVSCTREVQERVYSFLLTSDLLPLLDGVNGVRLELKLLRAAQFPVEDDDDENS